MAAPSRPQPQRNGRSLPRRIVDTIRATLGRMRPINRPRGQAPRQPDAVGKHTPGRLRHLRERSVAGIRHLAGQSVTTARSLPARVGRQLSRLAPRSRGMAGKIDTIPGTVQPIEAARNRTKATAPGAGRAANRRPGAAERAAPAKGHQVEPAKGRGTTRRTSQPQAKPRQAKRRQDLEHQTVRQLRERAREAGVQGRSSMTKTSSSRPCANTVSSGTKRLAALDGMRLGGPQQLCHGGPRA